MDKKWKFLSSPNVMLPFKSFHTKKNIIYNKYSDCQFNP